MAKGLGIFNIVAGGICTLASVLHFSNYATKEAGPEVDLLRGTSAYVQQYQGETPKDALEYAQRTLAIVGRNDAFSEDASKLEKELQEISTQIGESKTPSVYQPVLKNIGEKIDDVLDDKARDKGSLPWGVGMGALALLNFGLGAYNLGRRED
jgi:hypothetical protein